MKGAIEAYLATLRQELAFDRRLSERLSAEIEDHFADMLEQEGDDEDAQRRVIARMGDPKRLAASMARSTLSGRTTATWRTLALSAVAVFLAMRLRNLLMPADGSELGSLQIALVVDRTAFWAAIAMVGSAWLLSRGRSPHINAKPPIRTMFLGIFALAVSGAAGLYLLASSLGSNPVQAFAMAAFAAAMEWAALIFALGALHGMASHAELAKRPQTLET